MTAVTMGAVLTTGHVGLNVGDLDAPAAERGRFGTGRPGPHHLSFRVGSIEEVRGYEERLRGLGADFLYEGEVLHGEGRTRGGSMFFEIPDGIRLGTYAPGGAGPRPRLPALRPAGSFRGAFLGTPS